MVKSFPTTTNLPCPNLYLYKPNRKSLTSKMNCFRHKGGFFGSYYFNKGSIARTKIITYLQIATLSTNNTKIVNTVIIPVTAIMYTHNGFIDDGGFTKMKNNTYSINAAGIALELTC